MGYTIEFEPAGVRLVCEAPLTISEAARQAGLAHESDCGRKGTCGKCKVLVHSDRLPLPSTSERLHLSEAELQMGWRLACRAALAHDARVQVPARAAPVLQVRGRGIATSADNPIALRQIEVSPPALDDQRGDLERVAAALRPHGIAVWADLPALRALPDALRDGDWRATVALRGCEMIGVRPGAVSAPLGLAVDVGTSKLSCYLVDLASGQMLAALGIVNPQVVCGADVMTRLEAAMNDRANAGWQQRAVVDAINRAARELCGSWGVTQDHILDFCLVGNTAMHHLLLGLPVMPLGLVPFVATTGAPLESAAAAIGLSAAPGANMYLPPLIAAFVGSDHLAFLLAADFRGDGVTRLGIDIGTNTEIALEAHGRIASCSTPSGPAFEGAHVRHGMRAAPGAISHVFIGADGSVYCDVIGGQVPVGICGSGVVDALAEMHRTGIVNARGRLQVGSSDVVRLVDGKPVACLTFASDGRPGIFLTQHDIEQVLLAKGAIRAGIDALMDHLAVAPSDMHEVVIAGAFGSFVDPLSAVRIGLLPPVAPKRVRAVGNAAGVGACLMLASYDARRRATDLAQRVEYLELTLYTRFAELFARGTRLPDRVTFNALKGYNALEDE